MPQLQIFFILDTFSFIVLASSQDLLRTEQNPGLASDLTGCHHAAMIAFDQSETGFYVPIDSQNERSASMQGMSQDPASGYLSRARSCLKGRSLLLTCL